MTPRQQRFVQEYLIDLNATQAAIRAGYSRKTASEMAYQLLQKTSVQEAIQAEKEKREARTRITQDEVLRDLALVRDMCLGRVPVRNTEVLKSAQVGIEVKEIEGVVFEPTAANRALELMAKHLGMFTDKVEMTGKDGGAIQLSDTEAAGRIAGIIAAVQARQKQNDDDANG